LIVHTLRYKETQGHDLNDNDITDEQLVQMKYWRVVGSGKNSGDASWKLKFADEIL